MIDVPMKSYWMGKDIEEMSREELIEVVQHLGRQVQEYTAPGRARVYALGQVEMWKRGERCS